MKRNLRTILVILMSVSLMMLAGCGGGGSAEPETAEPETAQTEGIGIHHAEIDIADLVGEKLIVPSRKAMIDTIYKWFREEGAEPEIICEMDSYLDAAALAGRQVGISIYPRTAYIPNDSLVFRELSGAEKKLEYHFVWRKGHPLPTIEEKFIDHVRSKGGNGADTEG